MRFLLFLSAYIVSVYIIFKKHKKDGSDDNLICKYMTIIVYHLNKYILGVEQEVIKEDPLLFLKDKVLILLNHQNYCDWSHMLHFLYNEKRFDFNCIFKKELINTPLLGKFVERRFMWIERDYQKDIQNIKNQLHKLGDTYLFFIFPEGTFSDDKDTNRYSNDYMKLMNKPSLKYLLSPKYKGVQLLLENIEFDQIIDMTMIFKENYPKNYDENIMGTTYSSLLLDQYPQKCVINLREIKLNKNNLKNDILDIWVEKDKIIDKYYSQNRMIYCNPYKKIAKNISIIVFIYILFILRKKILKVINKINFVNS
jgi:1-acyl-sn-glycerol-3-phosphate acyltransferase